MQSSFSDVQGSSGRIRRALWQIFWARSRSAIGASALPTGTHCPKRVAVYRRVLQGVGYSYGWSSVGAAPLSVYKIPSSELATTFTMENACTADFLECLPASVPGCAWRQQSHHG